MSSWCGKRRQERCRKLLVCKYHKNILGSAANGVVCHLHDHEGYVLGPRQPVYSVVQFFECTLPFQHPVTHMLTTYSKCKWSSS